LKSAMVGSTCCANFNSITQSPLAMLEP